MPVVAMCRRADIIDRAFRGFVSNPYHTANLTATQFSKLRALTSNGIIPCGNKNRKLTCKRESGELLVYTTIEPE